MRKHPKFYPAKYSALCGESLHIIWKEMRRRCNNPKPNQCAHYKDKGITIYEEWNYWPTFADWAFANGYVEGLSLERKDNNKNYCPDNCIFIPKQDQGKNTSRIIRVNGISLHEHCKRNNLPYQRIIGRLRIGWSLEKALTKGF